MSILCKIFGHKMRLDSSNAAGPSTCKRCGHKEPGITWPKPPEKPTRINECEKCGREKIVASQGVIGFPEYIIKGSRIEYCGFCDDPPQIELIVGTGKVT